MHVYYTTNKNNRTSQDINVDEMVTMDVRRADVTIKRTTIFLKIVQRKKCDNFYCVE